MADLTVEELREAQQVEYGTYVAKERITIGGALAFNIGDPVPVSHVDRGVVEKTAVEKVTPKAGQEAQATSVTPKK